MIAGQSGETQWVKHGPNGTTGPIQGTINGETFVGVDPNATGNATTQGVPIVNDPQPWWGSEFDATVANRQPEGAVGNSPSFVQSEFYGLTNIAPNLTFASVPLTLMGKSVKDITQHEGDPFNDLADIQNDIPYIRAVGGNNIDWRWYQNGYDVEPYDANGVA